MGFVKKANMVYETDDVSGVAKCLLDGMKWRVEYCNDVSANDESFWKWWEITNDGIGKEEKVFKCTNKKDAKWLCDLLNKNT